MNWLWPISHCGLDSHAEWTDFDRFFIVTWNKRCHAESTDFDPFFIYFGLDLCRVYWLWSTLYCWLDEVSRLWILSLIVAWMKQYQTLTQYCIHLNRRFVVSLGNDYYNRIYRNDRYQDWAWTRSIISQKVLELDNHRLQTWCLRSAFRPQSPQTCRPLAQRGC